jgi:hypothetical protein
MNETVLNGCDGNDYSDLDDLVFEAADILDHRSGAEVLKTL